ncbi:hypothetical protein Dimus_009768 [Dionaea muscipula]
MSGARSSQARSSGGWIPVIHKRIQREYSMIRGRRSNLITLFIEDILDSMKYSDMYKLYAKFGVELRVKFADLYRKQGGKWQRKDSSMARRVNVIDPLPVRNMKNQEEIPTIKVDTISNGWLYRSVVATFAEHRSTEYLLDSFMNEVKPWSVTTECSSDREVWLSCYGVPVHAWNVGTFCKIGKVWGDVVQVEDDTAKCEDERPHSSEVVEDDDDVEGDGNLRTSRGVCNDSSSFIIASQDVRSVHREGNGVTNTQKSRGEEPRRHDRSAEVSEKHFVEDQPHVSVGNELAVVAESNDVQGFLLDSGPDHSWPKNKCLGPVQ